MIYSLENSKITITASTTGGELHSITGKKEETEYLWDGDPQYWKYHAPTLFPIVGKLVDSQYRVDGKTYELPAHGIARISEFELLNKTSDSLTFELKYSQDSLKVYPYKFSLQITYTLEENTVKVTYKVINLDDKDISFSIGAHPAFMCPIDENDTLEDCYLEFNKNENSSVIKLTPDVLLCHEKRELLNGTQILELSQNVFNDGALVFDDLKSNKITIKSKNSNKSLGVEFTGFPHMGIWAPETGAPFVCIEPWFGHADYSDFKGEFKEKAGSILLEKDKEFSASYKILITE